MGVSGGALIYNQILSAEFCDEIARCSCKLYDRLSHCREALLCWICCILAKQ